MWTLPNVLTASRVVAAPCVALAFSAFDRPTADWVALLLFVGAAVTDWIDGWIARRHGSESAFGRMLDPIADKAMAAIALAVLMALYGLGPMLTIPVATILLRETLVAGLREFLGGASLKVTRLAKWKTTAQLSAIAVLLAAAPATAALGVGAGAAVYALGLALLWLAAALTAVTGWDYFSKGMALLRAREGRA
ncbi:MAG: CDP-diacylglycerol--glycerol-3-phosphate 3-phosphatidyltransferase [Rhodobacteraceae bacterium]|nr:MAG: CDP-diacylglycerol--glycerol-3-phosphate 3-phosphatidyltransferase [Paracoccaceae bacterium]